MLHCSNCGKEAPPSASLCPFCGKILSAGLPSSGSNPTSTASLPHSAVVPISYLVQTKVIPFEAKASRLELFVRIVWGLLLNLVFFVYSLIYGIIILLYGIIAGILLVINFFIILITGRQWKTAFDWQAKLIQKSGTYYARLYNFMMRRTPYLRIMTDRRPPLEMEPGPSTTPEEPPPPPPT